MKLIFLGAPGAGKGTQAEIISEKLGIPTISTGNILRAAVRDCTPVGLRAKAIIEAGGLVPDDIVIGIVGERVARSDCDNGFILDGVPRTIRQADALAEAGIEVDCVINLSVSDSDIESRMTGRRICEDCSATFHITHNPPKVDGICDVCGGNLTIRKDDMPETVRHRLKVYHSETEPLIQYYTDKGLLRTVDGTGSLEATTEQVLTALGIN